VARSINVGRKYAKGGVGMDMKRDMEDDFEAFERENSDLTPEEMSEWLDSFIKREVKDEEELPFSL